MSTIAFVDTNSAGNGTRAMLAAQERGHRAHFLARDPDEYRSHAINPLEVADEVTVVETLDAVKLLRALDGRQDHVAVMAFDELRVVQAAMAGELLGVPVNPTPAAMLRVRFKDRMRSALDGTRWAIRWALCDCDAPPQRSPVGYPCVVKPVDEAASVGVRVCRDDEDFELAVAGVREVVAVPNGRGYRLLHRFLVEELLDGTEFSAELAWDAHAHEWRLLGYTTKDLSAPPSRAEVGHVFPHTFGAAEDERLLAELRAILAHLGLRDTVVHAEFRLDGDVLRLIEVNPRPGGNRIGELMAMTVGVHLADVHLAAHLGQVEPLLDGATAPGGFAGIRFALPDRPGLVTDIEVEPTPEDGDVVALRTAATPRRVGDRIDNEAYLGHVVAHGATAAVVERRLRAHVRRIRPRYAAEPEGVTQPR
jgi:biotin carboxylase